MTRPPWATAIFGNVSGSASAATVEPIDSAHANPRASWLAAGSPQYCNKAQVAAELAASALMAAALDVEALGAGSDSGGKYAVTLALENFSVARIKIDVA